MVTASFFGLLGCCILAIHLTLAVVGFEDVGKNGIDYRQRFLGGVSCGTVESEVKDLINEGSAEWKRRRLLEVKEREGNDDNTPHEETRKLQELPDHCEAGAVARQIRDSDSSKDFGALDDEEENHTLMAIVLYFCFIYLLAGIIGLVLYIFTLLCPFTPPTSIIWFLFGGILMVCANRYKMGMLGDGIRAMGSVDSEIIFLVLLPVLLYEGAVNTDWHMFTRMLPISILLAYGGVIFTALCLAGLFFGIFPIFTSLDCESLRGSFWEALVLGSSVASTDPVAVISVLKALHTPAKMLSMFEGESLLNDGTSVAIYQFVKVFATGEAYTAGGIIWLVIRLLFVGPLFGGAWAFATCLFVQSFSGVPTFQIVVLLANVYISYFVSDHFCGLSGPLTAVSFGLYVCARKNLHMDSKCLEVHHSVISTLAVFAESAIFVIGGNVAFRFQMAVAGSSLYATYWRDGFVVYLCMLLVRAVMFLICFPIIRSNIFGFSWRECFALIWGGLRGAIVIAIALMIEDDVQAAPGDVGFRAAFVEFAVFTISCSTLFVLAVNGTTFAPIFKLLNPYPSKPFRRVYLNKVMKQIDEVFDSRVSNGECDVAAFTKLEIVIMDYAKKMVPDFGWRQVDKWGKFPRRTPNLKQVARDLRKATDAYVATTTPEELRNNVATRVSVLGVSEVISPRSAMAGQIPTRKTQGVIFTHQPSGLGLNFPRRRTMATAPFTRTSADQLTGRYSQAQIEISPPPRASMDGEFLHYREEFSDKKNVFFSPPASSPSNPPAAEYSDAGGAAPTEAGGEPKRKISHRDTIEQVNLYLHEHKEPPVAVEELRNERGADLFVMVGNALKHCYKEYAEENFIGGKAMARLERSLVIAQDFSTTVGDKCQVWKEVTKNDPEHHQKLHMRELEDFKTEQKRTVKHNNNDPERANIENVFEVEWLVLKYSLSSSKKRHRWIREHLCGSVRTSFILRTLDQDVQAVIAYICAHEELLEKGGDEFAQILAGAMFDCYERMLETARDFLATLSAEYPQAFNDTVVRMLAIKLVNFKQTVVDEHSENGILMEEDREAMLEILDRQRQRLIKWNHLDIWALCWQQY